MDERFSVGRPPAGFLLWVGVVALVACGDDDAATDTAASASSAAATTTVTSATSTAGAGGAGDSGTGGDPASGDNSATSVGGGEVSGGASQGGEAADGGGPPGAGGADATSTSSNGGAGGSGGGQGGGPTVASNCAALGLPGLTPGESIYLDTWSDGGTRPVLSGDGRRVAFSSDALDIEAISSSGVAYVPNGGRQIFVLDLPSQLLTIVSVDDQGAATSDDCELNEDALSFTGDIVVFECDGDDLVPNDAGRTDIFAHVFVDVGPWPAGSTIRVSRAANSDGDLGGTTANGDSTVASVAALAPIVGFSSTATNLVSGTSPSGRQSYIVDLVTGEASLVSSSSAGEPSNATCGTPSLSADGEWVAFPTPGDNVAEPGPFDDSEDYFVLWHVFLRDLGSGAVLQTDTAADAGGFEASGPACTLPITCGSFSPSLSGDGSLLVYDAVAANLVAGEDDDDDVDVYLYDRDSGETRLLSAGDGDGASDSPEVSEDGAFVVFRSAEAFDGIDVPGHFVVASNDPGAPPNRVSILPDGTPADVAINTAQDMPNLSSDGSLVTFDSRVAGEPPRLVLRCLF